MTSAKHLFAQPESNFIRSLYPPRQQALVYDQSHVSSRLSHLQHDRAGHTGCAHAVLFLRPSARLQNAQIANEQLPSISVVVPVRNEETKVARCLESLAAQDYPNFEIIVIDDKSTDASGRIIAEITSQSFFKYQSHSMPRKADRAG